MKSGIPIRPITSCNKPGMPEPSTRENSPESTDLMIRPIELSLNAGFLNKVGMIISNFFKKWESFYRAGGKST